MSTSDPQTLEGSENLEDVERKLQQLLSCVIQKAKADAQFATELQAILGKSPIYTAAEPLERVAAQDKSVSLEVAEFLETPELQVHHSSSGQSTDPSKNLTAVPRTEAKSAVSQVAAKTTRKSKKPMLNPVEYLHQTGADELRKTLEEMPNSDLSQILRSLGGKKGKGKNPDRPKMINDIIEYTVRKLNQGGVFL
jgi:hypothetical protein